MVVTSADTTFIITASDTTVLVGTDTTNSSLSEKEHYRLPLRPLTGKITR